MFTEIEVSSFNIESLYEYCFDKLDENLIILKNNSKVLSFLTDIDSSQELFMLVQSLNFALKHARFELMQNIILSLKENSHKLAALEIKYFDENNSLLRVDIYNTFMAENFKKHAFVSPKLKEILNILDMTISLSPTNAAFAIKSFQETFRHAEVHKLLKNSNFSEEFISQIKKRYEANFGMPIEENDAKKQTKKDFSFEILNFKEYAM